MKSSSRSRKILVPLALALILAFVLIAATPQGRALAQEFLALFSHTESDRIPLPTEAGPAAITPLPGIAEGEALTSWPIFKPAWLPEGFVFQQIDYRSEAAEVVQEYIYQPAMGMQAGYFYLGQRKTPYTDAWPVGASAQIESVKIGDTVGEYVIGAWGGDADQQVWEANPNFQHLRWKTGEFYFNIDFTVMSVEQAELANSPYYISKEKLIAIANSMK